MRVFTWIIIAICLVVVSAIAIAIYYYYTKSTSTTTTTTSSSTALQIYGYKYVPNTKSLGTVLKTSVQTSDLACADVLAVTDNGIGANYNTSSQQCDILSGLLPLTSTSGITLITMDYQKLTNGIANFTPTESTAQKGLLYSDKELAYLPFAASLCANIPACSGYATTFDSVTNVPIGCLLADSQTTTASFDPTMITYTGTRTDAIVHNAASNTTNVWYRWRTEMASGSENVFSVTSKTSLDGCGALLAAAAGTGPVAGVWATDGTCTLYSAVGTLVTNEPTTLIVSSTALSNYTRYSNAFAQIANLDYPNAPTVTTGLENSNAYTVDEALLACANTASCNFFLRNLDTNTYVFRDVGADDLGVASSSNAIGYYNNNIFY